jgi:hypothetical protein
MCDGSGKRQTVRGIAVAGAPACSRTVSRAAGSSTSARGVRDVIAVGERQHVRRRVGPELATHEPADPSGPRHVERHHAVPARHVVLPADPRHREALTHQKTVAEVLGRRGVRHAHRAVEHAEGHLAPTVGDVEQQAAVPTRGIGRAQQVKVALELDPTVGAARRQRKIGDRGVQVMRGIDGDSQRPGELLLGAGGTERMTVEDERARVEVERGHRH